jgi:hypothetical protein
VFFASPDSIGASDPTRSEGAVPASAVPAKERRERAPIGTRWPPVALKPSNLHRAPLGIGRALSFRNLLRSRRSARKGPPQKGWLTGMTSPAAVSETVMPKTLCRKSRGSGAFKAAICKPRGGLCGNCSQNCRCRIPKEGRGSSQTAKLLSLKLKLYRLITTTGDPLGPRRMKASYKSNLFSSTWKSRLWSRAIEPYGALLKLEASGSYKIIYTSFLLSAIVRHSIALGLRLNTCDVTPASAPRNYRQNGSMLPIDRGNESRVAHVRSTTLSLAEFF